MTARRRGFLWARRLLAAAVGTTVLLVLVIVLAAAWLGRPQVEWFERPRGTAIERDRTSQPLGEALELQADDGFIVRLGVVRDLTHDRPRPVLVVLGGHRTGRDAVRLVGDPGAIAVVAVDYPYDGPDKIRGVRQAFAEAPHIRHALLNTPRALSQALDWVLAQPWADATRTELLGVSLGVPFAAVAGARDTRFSRVWLIQGSGDNEVWLERNLERRIGQPLLRGFAAWTLHRLAHGPSFRTADWVAQIAPRPVVIVGARADERLSHDLVEQLYTAAGEPRELLWVPGRHVNPRRPETVQPLLALVRERIQ